MGEFVFTIGGTYAHKLQLGASVGANFVRYINKSEYTESSDSTDLESYTFGENIQTTGTGYNIKLGVIYSPIQSLRFGFAFHSPTFYQLKDVFSYSMESKWRTPDADGKTSYYYDTENFNDNGTTENEFTYTLITPMRFVGSMAFVVGRYGILSADYEYINYSQARLRAIEDNFAEQNDRIKTQYNSNHNIRLGAEVRLAPFYLRGGASYYGSPYSTGFMDKGSVTSFSAGLGFKAQKFYMDIAFNRSEYARDYKMFDYIKTLQ